MIIQVLEVEMAREMETLSVGADCKACRILVRHQKVPLGWVHLHTTKKKQFTSSELKKVLLRKLNGSLADYLLTANQQPALRTETFAPVSIVVCTRNRTSYLSHCLHALLQLNYPAYEIIVVDNAPDKEDTKNLVANLPVRYVREDVPGLDRARNRGISESKYGIVAFTDDDAKVDPFWLHAINIAFKNPGIMAVSGLVAPAELETPAQHIFELGYGGMGHGFEKKYFNRQELSRRRMLWASAFGIGANMAFRKEVFEKIGDFHVAFDVGTPTHGGGDVEMFFRLVNSGYTMLYEPSMLVWHTHRKCMGALKKQIRDNGRSTGCFLIHLFRHKQISRLSILGFLLFNWLWQWNLKNLLKPRKHLPRSFSLYELSGLLSSPFAYRASMKKVRRYKTA